MGEQQENKDSALGAILATIGAVAALISGNAQDMSAGAIIMLMLIVGVIGYGIGRWVDTDRPCPISDSSHYNAPDEYGD